MPGVANGNGPSYISAHSADVILSDIRPVKLKPEALGAINVLLDEFLHVILSTSRSLSTEKLRSSLLSVLPTSLGKEALLEAEVELRAYWERTNSRGQLEDDSRTFHLQWSFELLRLKCSAYSTLNEDDEDPKAEGRVNDIFSKAHSHSPQLGLLDPAALYLTAILESMCEHILSNVGRVAARDSSRTYATTNDLFVALCEDDSIYGFFRTMKVYQQIETMAQAQTSSRRSRSISQYDQSLSRTSSQHAELFSATPRSRQSSSEVQAALVGARVSAEKLRRKDSSAQGHQRNSSSRSDTIRSDESSTATEDETMQREFDDLMRSASTMKMSLTPDRLKTMEAFKQEKDQKTFARRPDPPFPHKSSKSLVHPPSFPYDATHRPRQGSLVSSTVPGIVPTRLRSLSTTASPWGKISRTPSIKSASKTSLSSSTSALPPADMPAAPRYASEKNGYPKRTRRKARDLASMDLDDILNLSDDDLDTASSARPSTTFTPPKKTSSTQLKVSQSTRELIDFLAEGPPPSLSRAGRDLVDFLAEGPPDYTSSNISLDKSKGGNRLQKMISKLSLASSDKGKVSPEMSGSPQRSRFESKVSSSTLSSLANRPIPPRPRPIVPSAPSAFATVDISDANKVVSQPQRIHTGSPPRDPSSSVEWLSPEPTRTTVPPISNPSSTSGQPNVAEKISISVRSPPSAFVHSNGVISNGNLPSGSSPPRSSHTTSKPPIKTTTPSPVTVVQAAPTIAESDIRDMHRLLTNATTADECRLICGMFMARNGISVDQKEDFSTQVPHIGKSLTADMEVHLETSLVELLLGNSPSFDLVTS